MAEEGYHARDLSSIVIEMKCPPLTRRKWRAPGWACHVRRRMQQAVEPCSSFLVATIPGSAKSTNDANRDWCEQPAVAFTPRLYTHQPTADRVTWRFMHYDLGDHIGLMLVAVVMAF